jgi:hypothetical protein
MRGLSAKIQDPRVFPIFRFIFLKKKARTKLMAPWTGFMARVHEVYGSSLNDDHPSTDLRPGSNQSEPVRHDLILAIVFKIRGAGIVALTLRNLFFDAVSSYVIIKRENHTLAVLGRWG